MLRFEDEELLVWSVRVKFNAARDLDEVSHLERFEIAQVAKSWVYSIVTDKVVRFLGRAYEVAECQLILIIGPYKSEEIAYSIAESLNGGEFLEDFVEAQLLGTTVKDVVKLLTEDRSLCRFSNRHL